MHDEIKKFYLEGELGEPNIVDTKDRLVHHVETMMREYNYVPSIDNEAQFTLNYDEGREVFDFKLTVYGVRVSKEEAWSLSGVASGKPIPRHIPLAK